MGGQSHDLGQLGEKIFIWINSNDMPDFVMWDFNCGDYINYTEQGLIRQLPDGWKDRWPLWLRYIKTLASRRHWKKSWAPDI